MPTSPAISVIIPTHNRRKLLAQTLDALSRQDLPSNQFEVLVIVDGSNDGTQQMLDSLRVPYRLRTFSQPCKGPAAARNVGIQNAQGAITLFLDDDIFASPNLLSQHVQSHQAEDDLVLTGAVLPHPDSPPSFALENLKADTEAFLNRIQQQGGLRLPDDTMSETNTSVRRHHLKEVGGYDERFFRQRENEELGYRLYRKGLRFLFLPEACAYHFYLKQDEDLMADAYWAGRSDILFILKHPERREASPLLKFFKGSWVGQSGRHALFLNATPLGVFLRMLARALGSFYSPVNRTRGTLSTLRRFCAYSQGVKDAGYSRHRLNQLLQLKVPIFLYHYVGDRRAELPGGRAVEKSKFEKHVRYLFEHGYKTISLTEWMDGLAGKQTLPEKPVILTFDDGYKTVYSHAFPILSKFNFKATIFLVSGQIGGTNVWDIPKGYPSLPLLSNNEILEMQKHGNHFGSHGRTHRSLIGLSELELRDEIQGSKRDLENLLGRPIDFFAYPYGDENEQIRREVKSTGYLGACSFVEVFARPIHDSLALPRIGVDGTISNFSFWLQLWLEKNPGEMNWSRVQSVFNRATTAFTLFVNSLRSRTMRKKPKSATAKAIRPKNFPE